jgi:hypothetical protein
MRSGVGRYLSLMGLWLLCAAHAAAAGQQSDYRVTGVVTGGNTSMAIIEQPDGESLVVGPGDSINDGQVIAITTEEVRIRFPDGEWVLPLSGGPAERRNSGGLPEIDTSSRSEFVLVKRNDHREIYTAKAVAELKKISRSVPAGRPASRAGRNTGDAENAQVELTNRLKGMFDLPEDALVRDINGKSVTSVAESLSDIEQTLERRDIVRLGFEAGAVYVLPK